MPEMTIQLRCNPATGQRDIVVKLHGDEELLPTEHENLHRRLVEKLIEGGLLKSEEQGRLIVEREEGVVAAPNQSSGDSAEPKAAAAQQ
jgi:hypothetical protein